MIKKTEQKTKVRKLPIVAGIGSVVVITLLGFGLALGFGIGLGVAIGLAAIEHVLEKRKNESSGFSTTGSSPIPRQVQPYDPEKVQEVLLAYYLRIRKKLRNENPDLQEAVYSALRSMLTSLPSKSVTGAAEIWEIAVQDLQAIRSQIDSSEGNREVASPGLIASLGRISSYAKEQSDLLMSGVPTIAEENPQALEYLQGLRDMPDPLPEDQRRLRTLDSLVAGDSHLQIDGEVFRVTKKFRYKEGRSKWDEVLIESLKTGEAQSLEWERDDTLQILFQEPGVYTLDQIGISAGRLEEMDDEEEGAIHTGKTQFHYNDSGKAKCFEGDSAEGEEFQYFDFQSGKRTLAIENWDGEHKAYFMRQLKIQEVEILR
jgi:hypothetical protein